MARLPSAWRRLRVRSECGAGAAARFGDAALLRFFRPFATGAGTPPPAVPIPRFQARAQLRELDLSHCTHLTDSALVTAARAPLLRSVRVLRLARCTHVSDAAVLALLEHCPRLTLLDMAYSAVSERTLQRLIARPTAPALHALSIYGCTRINLSAAAHPIDAVPLSAPTAAIASAAAALTTATAVVAAAADDADASSAWSSSVLGALIVAQRSLVSVNFGGLSLCRADELAVAAAVRSCFQSGRCVRVNLQTASALPSAISVRCDVCSQPLYESVRAYVLDWPAQPHIASTLYVCEAPAASAVRRSTALGGSSRAETMINCRRNCHGFRFLIDAGSGYTEMKGHAYAVAVGPGLAVFGAPQPQPEQQPQTQTQPQPQPRPQQPPLQ
jgi:hypothetical protein